MFDTLCGVQKELSSHGYTLMLMEPPDNVSPETFLKDQIARRIADGILIHGSCNIPSLSKIMLKYQYENVAFLAERRTDDISMRRLNGFLGGMYDYGYRIPEEYICYTDSTGEDAYRQSMALLSLPEPPRAIVCENSLLALSLCNAIREKRLRVPDEVAFLTFDSYPYSALIEPSMIWAFRPPSCCFASWKTLPCWYRPTQRFPSCVRVLQPCPFPDRQREQECESLSVFSLYSSSSCPIRESSDVSSCPIWRISSFKDIILASSAATICAHSTSCSLMCSGALPSNL